MYLKEPSCYEVGKQSLNGDFKSSLTSLVNL